MTERKIIENNLEKELKKIMPGKILEITKIFKMPHPAFFLGKLVGRPLARTQIGYLLECKKNSIIICKYQIKDDNNDPIPLHNTIVGKTKIPYSNILDYNKL